MDLHVSTDVVGGHPVVSLTGNADLSSVPELHGHLQRAIGEHPGRRLVVDLDGLVSLDDTALGVLLGAAARSRDAGGDLVVVCTGGRLRSRLAATRFDCAVDVLDAIA